MIQFACPSCAAVFSVGDEKAGKTGKCPKCDAKFVIPDAEPSAAPSPPPPPVDDNVEIKPCPGCQAKLTVARSDIGLDVECPYCKTVYKAAKSGGSSAVIRTDRPSKRSAPVEGDDEDRPRRHSRRDEEDDEDDRPSKRRDRYDDDDDRPRKKRRRNNRVTDSRTAGLLSLITGIISIFPGCCCVLLAIPLGLTAIISGVMGLKTSARGMSIAGIVMGSLSIVWMIVAFALGASGALDDFKAANPRNNPFQRGR